MQEPSLLPRPTAIERRPGTWRLAGPLVICYPAAATAAAELWSSALGGLTGAPPARGGAGAGIELVLDRRVAADAAAAAGPTDRSPGGLVSCPIGGAQSEAYRLAVTPEGVRAAAASPAGLCNALQSLRQLLPAECLLPGARREVLELACLEILDAPRFAWRGGHLDVARHFVPAQFLYRFVDLLALHKLNVMHLHLTDDQGWRLPSRRFPRLEEVSSWRHETLVGHARDPRGAEEYDGTPHGGTYPATTLASLAAYGAARNVTVLPEIDLPGHVQAVLAAYPELGCTARPLEVMRTWGVSEHVLGCSAAAMDFVEGVVGELAEIFPSPYLHLGGDECATSQWRDSPSVAARLRELGLAGPDELQPWFTARMAELCGRLGRRLVGWDEILEGGPMPDGTTVMSWRGERGGIVAARAGHDVVMCPEKPCYFDHYQSAGADEPLAFGGLNTLEDVYAFSPLPAALEGLDGPGARVLGTQFQLWSEYLPGPRAVEYMAFPRAAALAEVAWSGPGGDLADFERRLGSHLGRLDVLGVNYRPRAGPLGFQRGGSGRRRRVALAE